MADSQEPVQTLSPEEAQAIGTRLHDNLEALHALTDVAPADRAWLTRTAATIQRDLDRYLAHAPQDSDLKRDLETLAQRFHQDLSRLQISIPAGESHAPRPAHQPAASGRMGAVGRAAVAGVVGAAQTFGNFAPVATQWASTNEAFEQQVNTGGRVIQSDRQPHRRTGVEAIDRALVIEPEMTLQYHGQLPHGSVARGAFLIRKTKNDRFYLSPTTDADAQEIEVTIDPEDTKSDAIVDFLKKNQGWIVPAVILKKRDKDGNPIFVLAHADPWRDADAGVKTAVWDSKSKSTVAKSIKYDKYVYMALNARYRQLADILVQETRIELLRLDQEQSKNLLTLAGTLEAFKRNTRLSNLESDYNNAVEGMQGMAFRRWRADAANTGQPDTAFQRPTRDAILESVLKNQTEKVDANGQRVQKTYAEMIAGELPRPLSYVDPADGQTKTLTRLGQNLSFADDEQLPPHITAALRADPENYLAWAANRAILRSVAHHASAVSSRVEKGTDRRLSVLTDKNSELFKKGSTNYITRQNEKLAAAGVLFSPRNIADPIVPGLKKAEAEAHAAEFFLEDADMRFTKDSVRMGTTLFNTDFVDDDISKELGQTVHEGAANSVENAIAAVEARKALVEHDLLPVSYSNLVGSVNDVRGENGLPPIGRMPAEDWKATIGVLEIVTGNILKEIFGVWGDMEKPMGFFG